MKVRSCFLQFTSTLLLLFQLNAGASEFESLKNALSQGLGTTKAFKATVTAGGKTDSVYYSKDDSGKPLKVAVVQKAIYPPNCTHTWVVALDAKTSTVSEVRVVEMSCPHAFPTNKAFYLDQYKGKGPADVSKLKGSIQTIAKATGTCNLTTEAVETAIKLAQTFQAKEKS